jgi:hypothetical protein
MCKSRLILLGIAVMVGAMAMTSVTVYASPVWLVKGKVLESSAETSLATVTFGKMTIKWEDSATKTSFEAECKKSKWRIGSGGQRIGYRQTTGI